MSADMRDEISHTLSGNVRASNPSLSLFLSLPVSPPGIISYCWLGPTGAEMRTLPGNPIGKVKASPSSNTADSPRRSGFGTCDARMLFEKWEGETCRNIQVLSYCMRNMAFRIAMGYHIYTTENMYHTRRSLI